MDLRKVSALPEDLYLAITDHADSLINCVEQSLWLPQYA